MKSSSKVMKGIFWSAVASATWGISGTTIQFISQNQHIPTDWFLSTRALEVGGQAVLGRQQWAPTPWLTKRHG